MVVYNVYVPRKPSCRNMGNCIETDKGVIVAYPGTLFNILESERGVAFPASIVEGALPYTPPLHYLCADKWSTGHAILICMKPEEGPEICLCLAEGFWYAYAAQA